MSKGRSCRRTRHPGRSRARTSWKADAPDGVPPPLPPGCASTQVTEHGDGTRGMALSCRHRYTWNQHRKINLAYVGPAVLTGRTGHGVRGRGAWWERRPADEVEDPVPEPVDDVGDVRRDRGQVVEVDGTVLGGRWHPSSA